jgi:hypothetical protein
MPPATAPPPSPSPSSKEVGAPRNRPLLLEALFIAENIITGPQHFQHAFELEERFG